MVAQNFPGICSELGIHFEFVRNLHGLVDVSNILFFFCSGRGKGESRRWRAVADRFFLLKSPGGGGEGAEGPGGCLQQNWRIFWAGGGLNFFFRGRNVHQDGKRPKQAMHGTPLRS